MKVVERITKLGFSLPESPHPAGSYLPLVRTGNLLFVSGQLPRGDTGLITGKVGQNLEVKDGQDAARLALLSALAAVQAEIGDLDRVTRVIRLACYVNSAPGFTGQAQVADGASNLILAFYGDRGRHSRVSVGVSDLPLGAAVELELILEAEKDQNGASA